jgi:hypothetical protein
MPHLVLVRNPEHYHLSEGIHQIGYVRATDESDLVVCLFTFGTHPINAKDIMVLDEVDRPIETTRELTDYLFNPTNMRRVMNRLIAMLTSAHQSVSV